MNPMPALLSLLRSVLWGCAFGLAWQMLLGLAQTESLFLGLLAPALVLAVIWPIITATLNRCRQRTNAELILDFFGLYVGLALGLMLFLLASFPAQT